MAKGKTSRSVSRFFFLAFAFAFGTGLIRQQERQKGQTRGEEQPSRGEKKSLCDDETDIETFFFLYSALMTGGAVSA